MCIRDRSNAGGLGLIGAASAPAEVVREEVRKCKELTDKPFGVNIMLLNPNADDVAQIVIEEGVKVVTTGAGNPSKYMACLLYTSKLEDEKIFVMLRGIYAGSGMDCKVYAWDRKGQQTQVMTVSVRNGYGQASCRWPGDMNREK